MRQAIRESSVFLRRCWHLAAPFWQSRLRVKVGGMLALAMAFNIANVYLTVRLNTWSRDFFNAMENKDGDAFMYQLVLLFALAGIGLFLYANQKFLCDKAVQMWRGWLSENYTERWLTTKLYYRAVLRKSVDNPDQRIAEDLYLFPKLTVAMVFDFVDSFGSLGAFSVILWELSEAYTVGGVYIPGFMLWITVGFVIVGTWLVHRIGHRLIGLERMRQEYEADYRSTLIRLRERAKDIALLGGETREAVVTRESFARVFQIWVKNLLKKRQLNYFNSGYAQASGVVPYLLAAPKYFSGAFQMGELMQTVTAFNGMRVSLSWFILNYSMLAEWKAVVDRLTEFDTLLREGDTGTPFEQVKSTDGRLHMDAVHLMFPDAKAAHRDVTLTLAPGERVALTGPSGSGKTTLLYALRGLWPLGTGQIALPEGRQMFLTQTPYLPEATLAEVLSYPDAALQLSEEQCRAFLSQVELAHLVDMGRQRCAWDKKLSSGEQQRLAFARIWAQQPDWLFLDEALSCVDPACRERILLRLRTDFPSMCVLGIEHYGADSPFYDRQIDITEKMSAVL